MLLDALKYFEWYNEPENVRFNDMGMVVCSRPKTDFWQSTHHNFHKDNGHFFFTRSSKDFTITLQWYFDQAFRFDQCGLMLRADERNWFKAGLMSELETAPKLGSSLTNFGYSDWAVLDLEPPLHNIWYRLRRNGGDYIAYYSLDGENFRQLRLFHLMNDNPEVKIGAYACSPQRSGFECVLTSMDIE